MAKNVSLKFTQAKINKTTDLQTEIHLLKGQIKDLKERLLTVETKNLELDTQITLIQSRFSKGKQKVEIDESITPN